MSNSLLKRAARKAFRMMGIEVTRVRSQPPVSAAAGGTFREFTDSRGDTFTLIEGYRKRIWGADWDEMIRQRTTPTNEAVRQMALVSKGRNQVDVLESFLSLHGFTMRGKSVLEIGCYDGAACYALFEKGAERVAGIDLARGYVPSPAPAEAEIRESALWLDHLREVVRAEFGQMSVDLTASHVTFRDEDVCNLTERSVYDVVLSSSTLEHILDYNRGFGQMYESLKPGGVSIHNYHPFFCSSGAHFDTLDFPWGHVRLTSDDFRRYIQRYRPRETDIAEYRFFRTLNRMTLEDMQRAARTAGFVILDLLSSGEDWREVKPPVFGQCKENYPSLSLRDLISTGIIVLMKKN